MIFVDTLLQYLAEVVAILVIGLLGIFGTWLLNKMKEKKGLENIALATEQVIEAAQSTVLELQQTFVNDWKCAQNGKLTVDQINALKQHVLTITLSKLGQPTLNLLEGVKIDVSSMITSTAEAYILELKKDMEIM